MSLNQRIGIMLYWVAWPGIWLLLKRSKRTRVAIKSEGSILVVKPWLGNGKWSLPGGGLHPGEGERSALAREVFEETGLELNKNSLKQLKRLTYQQDGLQFEYVLFTYETPKQAQITRHTPEIAEAAWVKLNKLTKHTANNDVLVALKNT